MWIWCWHLLGCLISTLVPDSFCQDFSFEVKTCLCCRIVERINWDKISSTGVCSLPTFFPCSTWPSIQLVNVVSPLHDGDHLVVHPVSMGPASDREGDRFKFAFPSQQQLLSCSLLGKKKRQGVVVEKPKAQYHLLSGKWNNDGVFHGVFHITLTGPSASTQSFEPRKCLDHRPGNPSSGPGSTC